MNILKIYSLIIIGITLILNLFQILKSDKKNSRMAAFISFIIYLPVFIYFVNIRGN